ncbi:MAG: 4Fe-4S binding protein [Deltaproteobacteria bacterium]|nr:4Fe-4S binding protein [Deltaproteobacteria bacterium]
MEISAVKLIYFSPTQTSKTILEAISGGMEIGVVSHIDLTPPDAATRDFGELTDEPAVIGVPVYGGRVPVDAKERLKRLKADKTPAVLVVLYGNRAFEDALLELKNLALEAGFIPVAGAAFIGEHSFSSAGMPIAEGRPDADDMAKAGDFGKAVIEKIRGLKQLNDVPALQVPGDDPHRERNKPADISPSTDEDVCVLCGTCASVCPTEAVTVDEIVTTKGLECILCCACVKNCPTGARVMNAPPIMKIAEWLSTNFKERKEPDIFI